MFQLHCNKTYFLQNLSKIIFPTVYPQQLTMILSTPQKLHVRMILFKRCQEIMILSLVSVVANYRLGKRQRLSIARALLKDTPILILDEPTASLDAETERRVMQNIAEWGKDRIIFIITHRLSTIKTADCIAVLESGVIEEVGTHSELLELNKGYSEFVRSEMGEL